jgi:MFS family permease
MKASPFQGRRVFYGWYIVAAGLVCLWINTGLGFYSFPVFLVDLTENLGWGRGATTVGISVTFIIGGLASPLVGRLMPRHGPKRIILVGSLLMSAAFVLFGFMRTIWQFYLMCTMLAVGLSCTGTVTTSYAISDGVGLGGLTFVPLTRRLLDLFPWQMTFIIYGVFISLILLPVAATIFKRRPPEILPDGAVNDEAWRSLDKRSTESGDSMWTEHNWTLGAALGTRTFWAISITFILATFGQTPILVHQVAYFQDIGISAEKAASALGLCALLGIGGKLFFGAMADRYPARYAMALCFGLQVIGTILLMKTQALGSPFLFVIVWGFAMGGIIALEPLIVAECFGLQSFGVTLGMLYVFTTIGGSVGAPFAGFVFDTNRSYTFAFVLFIIAYLLATGLSFLAIPPRHKRRR